VVGIGINVGNSVTNAPQDIRSSAISLFDLLGRNHPSLDDVLFTLLGRWEQWLYRLVDSKTGTCLGLDADGALLLETDRGVQRILAGTVRRV
jgi:biotin-(acetyl-CoA carboxylase) ligase